MLNSLLQRLDANYLKSLASEPEQQEYFKLRPVYTSLTMIISIKLLNNKIISNFLIHQQLVRVGK